MRCVGYTEAYPLRADECVQLTLEPTTSPMTPEPTASPNSGVDATSVADVTSSAKNTAGQLRFSWSLSLAMLVAFWLTDGYG